MDQRPTGHDEPCIPRGLADGLGRLDAGSRAVWAADDPVLAAARAGSRRRVGQPWRVVGWSAGLTAAAAGLAVSAMVWFGGPGAQGPARDGETPSVAGVPATGNAAGYAAAPASPVTMLDAYRLTLMLDRDLSPSGAWDADADGRVTRADVDTMAARAVRLGEAAS